MTTVTIRRGDVMSARNHQEHLAQTHSGIISPEESAKRAPVERAGHEEWKQRLEDNWQSHLETLQKYVCELLIKNQKLRTALSSANEPRRDYRDAVKL
jgi:hypothetical protein